MIDAVRLPDQELPSDIPAELDDSRICYWRSLETVGGLDSLWLIYLPSGGIGNLSRHTVEEHDDRTITVSPSIKMERPGDPVVLRHGFLKRGVWHPCGDDRS